MQRVAGWADFYCMAAILFLVVILGLVVGGRAQALAADDGSALRLQVWQLGLGGFVLLVFAAGFALGAPLPVPIGGVAKTGLIVKGLGLIAVLAVLGFYARSRRPRDVEDF